MSYRIPSGFTLMPNEVPYWYGKMSWKANWLRILFGALFILIGIATTQIGLGILFLFLGILLLLAAYLRVVGSEYFVTSHRIYVKYGIIRRFVFEIKNEWITSTMVRQGFMERLLNYGDLIISTPGHYAGSVFIRGVSDPMHFRTIVEDILRKFRERQKIMEELNVLEREYRFGRIPREKYEELKKLYEEELKKWI